MAQPHFKTNNDKKISEVIQKKSLNKRLSENGIYSESFAWKTGENNAMSKCWMLTDYQKR